MGKGHPAARRRRRGESSVSKSGYFEIGGLTASTYIVLVTSGEAVLHQQVVRVYPSRIDQTFRVDIDLSK